MTLALHRPWQAQTLLDTPLGALRLAATQAGLAGAWFEDQRHHPGRLTVPDDARHPWLQQAAAELQRYWQARAHARPFVFQVTLDADGTPFQQAVWQALLAIPAGRLDTYGALARQLGKPQAVRAVGAAVGRNPVSIFIPCHRVLGADGGLTGYAGGLHRKQALLQLEGAWPEARESSPHRNPLATRAAA